METREFPAGKELRNLSAVYERVTRGDAPEAPSPGGEETLRRLIDEAAESAAMYELLALKLRGSPHERVLRRLAAEEKELERKLQADHLILTGDTHAVPPSHPSAPYLLRALSDQARRELARTRLPLPPLPELPAVSLRHAEELRSIIARIVY